MNKRMCIHVTHGHSDTKIWPAEVICSKQNITCTWKLKKGQYPQRYLSLGWGFMCEYISRLLTDVWGFVFADYSGSGVLKTFSAALCCLDTTSRACQHLFSVFTLSWEFLTECICDFQLQELGWEFSSEVIHLTFWRQGLQGEHFRFEEHRVFSFLNPSTIRWHPAVIDLFW